MAAHGERLALRCKPLRMSSSQPARSIVHVSLLGPRDSFSPAAGSRDGQRRLQLPHDALSRKFGKCSIQKVESRYQLGDDRRKCQLFPSDGVGWCPLCTRPIHSFIHSYIHARASAFASVERAPASRLLLHAPVSWPGTAGSSSLHFMISALKQEGGRQRTPASLANTGR